MTGPSRPPRTWSTASTGATIVCGACSPCVALDPSSPQMTQHPEPVGSGVLEGSGSFHIRLTVVRGAGLRTR